MIWFELLIWLLVIVTVVVVVKIQKKYFLTQNVFSLRFPILIALIFVGLPIAVNDSAPNIIKNLFVLNPFDFILLTPLTLIFSWTIMYTALIIYVAAPHIYVRPFRRDDQSDSKSQMDKLFKENKLPTWIDKYGIYLFSLLPIPLLYTCYIESAEALLLVAREYKGTLDMLAACWADEQCRPQVFLHNSAAIVGGIVLGVVFRIVAFKSRPVLKKTLGFLKNAFVAKVTPRLGKEKHPNIENFVHEITHSYSDLTILRAFSYFFLTLFIYFLGFILFDPSLVEDSPLLAIEEYQFPVMGYIVVLLIFFAWMLPALSWILDKYHISVLLALFGIFIALNIANDTDHYYDIKHFAHTSSPPNNKAQQGQHDKLIKQIDIPDNGFRYEDALSDWHKHQPSNNKTIVLVAASGGGITASYWTNVVLTNLIHRYGDDFAKSIFLISGVSGGGVGAMFLSDLYKEGRVLGEQERRVAVRKAGASSLSAVGWGITFPDLLRATVGGFWLDKKKDRGWAIEQRWTSMLKNKEATLRDLQTDFGKHRPILIFNATITETGTRLLLSPFTSDAAPKKKCSDRIRSRNFFSLYPNQDINIVTAARLSATFPYVSPIARPFPNEDQELCAYHVADGGYFDNFGIITIAEIIDELMAQPELISQFDKILVVQIRSSDTDAREEPESEAGWLYSVFGPLMTLLKVRTASQVERNEFTLEILEDSWEEKYKDTLIWSAVFELDTDSPLSWHLSEKEKVKICKGWSLDTNQVELKKVNRFFDLQSAQNVLNYPCNEELGMPEIDRKIENINIVNILRRIDLVQDETGLGDYGPFLENLGERNYPSKFLDLINDLNEKDPHECLTVAINSAKDIDTLEQMVREELIKEEQEKGVNRDQGTLRDHEARNIRINGNMKVIRDCIENNFL